MRFKKKPVEIEAWTVSELCLLAATDFWKLPKPIQDAYDKTSVLFMGDNTIQVRTLEGLMLAEKDDWLIQGIQGELYPCKPDIFEMTYDRVE